MSGPAKLTVASTFTIHPATSGGPLRIRGLYRQLAARCPVDVIALASTDDVTGERELGPGLREVRVPRSRDHAVAEAALERQTGLPIGDAAFPDLHELTPAFGEAIRASAVPGGVLVASHPFALPALMSAEAGLPIWYDAHNVELDLKRAMLPRNAAGKRLLKATHAVERQCCEQSTLVLCASSADAERLHELYRARYERLLVVPNGLDTSAVRFTTAPTRRRLQTDLRMPRPLALFVGSWHEPNLAAVRRIVDLAVQLPDVAFAIVGSVGWPLRRIERPANVELYGVVSDELKQSLLAVASVALNPMSDGSGTNMKMLDYLAAGVPVVSTEVGARGLALEPAHGVWLAPLDGFKDAVRAVLDEPVGAAEARARSARLHVERVFDWGAVAARLLAVIDHQTVAGAHATESERVANTA